MARGNDVLLDRHVYVSVGVCGDCCVTTRQLPVARARICDGRGTGLGPRGRRGRVCVEMSCEPVSLSHAPCWPWRSLMKWVCCALASGVCVCKKIPSQESGWIRWQCAVCCIGNASLVVDRAHERPRHQPTKQTFTRTLTHAKHNIT